MEGSGGGGRGGGGGVEGRGGGGGGGGGGVGGGDLKEYLVKISILSALSQSKVIIQLYLRQLLTIHSLKTMFASSADG